MATMHRCTPARHRFGVNAALERRVNTDSLLLHVDSTDDCHRTLSSNCGDADYIPFTPTKVQQVSCTCSFFQVYNLFLACDCM